MRKIAIVGVGNYGFALAHHLDRKEDGEMDLWVYDRKIETLEHIRQTKMHPKFFPTTKLSERVGIAENMEQVMAETEVVVLAMVSTALVEVLEKIKPLIVKPVIMVSVMKALDGESGRVLTEGMEERLAGLPVTVAALAGGTTGRNLVLEDEYLGATIACEDEAAGKLLKQIFSSPSLGIQLTTDVKGVQYAGSLKNLISLGVGIMRGFGFDYGTQTHTLSLYARECENLAVSLGAMRETFNFASQCWGNDMVMSATGETRNLELGMMLGEGEKFTAAVAEMLSEGRTIESTNTLASLSKVTDLTAYPLLHFLERLAREEVPAHELIKIVETYHQ